MAEIKNWHPFQVAKRGDPIRPIEEQAGICDRLRVAAFAERQARDAFLLAVTRFPDVSARIKRVWKILAEQEDKHLNWLLARLSELGDEPGSRVVSDRLWDSFMKARSAHEFAHFMAEAERRGQIAGERFLQVLKTVDPISAELFGQIAREEVAHIRVAERLFPSKPPQKTVIASSQTAKSSLEML